MMVNNSRQERPQVTRCAVCKIDLKGRFVYIDDETEKLLGLTKEELFGRQFTDFLDQHDIDTISAILTGSNRYETFFDAAQIGLREKTGITSDIIPKAGRMTM